MNKYCELEQLDDFRKVTDDSLFVHKYDNAIILPNKNLGPPFGIGGVRDSTGEFVKESGSSESSDIYYGGDYEIDESSIETSDYDVVYFGLFFKHWGHFLVDLVTRMWYVCKSDIANIQGIAYIGYEMDGNYSEFMKYLVGGGKIKLIHVTKPTCFHSVIVPRPSTDKDFYSDAYLDIFNRVVSNSGYKDCCEKFSGKKIYLTRGNYRRSHLKEMGEAAIETIFNKNGFVSMAPEGLTLKQQIAMWNSASVIACINGTIPLNLVFSITPVNLIVLNKTSIFHRNLLRMSKVNNDYPLKIVDCFYPREDHLAVELGSGPYFIYNSNKFIEFCSDYNLRNRHEGRAFYYLSSKAFLLYYRGVHFLMHIYSIARRMFRL